MLILSPIVHSWIRAGRAYLDDGRIFTMECDKMSAMSKKGLAQVDQFHAELEAADALYGQVIQALQVLVWSSHSCAAGTGCMHFLVARLSQ